MSELVRWEPAVGEIMPMPGDRIIGLDLSTPKGRITAYRCHVAASKQLQDMVGFKLEVVGFYLHHVLRIDDETGEEKPGPRCVLVLADDTRIATGSETAIKCLLAWASVLGMAAPWSPPLQFIVRAEARRKGPGKFLWLDIPDATTDPTDTPEPTPDQSAGKRRK